MVLLGDEADMGPHENLGIKIPPGRSNR